MTNPLLKCELAEKTGNILTPRGRMYFCAVAEKFVSKEDKAKGKDGSYTVTLVVQPDADLTLLKDKIKAKAKEKWGDKMPGNLKSPIRLCKDIFTKKGEAKYPPELANHYQITCNTFKQAPGVVDAKGNPISKLLPGESTDQVKERVKEECYSGRWARISVSPQWYDNESLGVKLWLNNVQVLDHDEKLGGRNSDVEDDFQPVGGAAAATGAAPKSADSVFD